MSNKRTSQNNDIQINSAISSSLGNGWIADVTGAAIASHISSYIKKANNSDNSMNSSQLYNLASLIDKLRKKRILDKRIADIKAIDTICKYIVNEKITAKESAKLAMEINDIREYGFNQPRNSGKEILIYPVFNLYYKKSFSKYIINQKDSTGPYIPSITAKDITDWPGNNYIFEEKSYLNNISINYGAALRTKIAWLLNQNTEFDIFFEAKGILNNQYDTLLSESERRDTVCVKWIYPNATGKINVNLIWYPSMRSTIKATSQLLYSFDFNLRSYKYKSTTKYLPEVESGRNIALYTNAGISAEYYISPEFSFELWANMSYEYGHKRSSLTDYYYNNLYKKRLYSATGCNFKWKLF